MKENIKFGADGTAIFENEQEAAAFLEKIKAEAEVVAVELLDRAELCSGQILAVGCSSSEVIGSKIGKASVPSVAEAILEGMLPHLEKKGVYLAAQCCEHLNRAIIIERELAEKIGADIVCVRPVPKAGGSFAAACYEHFADPVAVEHIKAHAGLDIGCTLIGMHLREVAVPLRLSVKTIGEAAITVARTRPKYIGGERAVYN